MIFTNSKEGGNIKEIPCMQETCKLLGWQCGHFQIADPLFENQASKKS